MDQKMRLFKDWVRESGSIVFFGGAGVSTESGIPDFRSTNGLYRQQYDYPPEEILSHTFFMKRPEEFFQFYRAKMLCPVGAGGEAEGRCHPEYRRAAPGGGQQAGL